MNWSRCSKLALVGLLALTVVAGTASAVSVSGNTPPSATVGSQQTATYTFTQPYSDYNTWTLHGTTDLTHVTWEVSFHEQGGSVSKKTYSGGSFDRQVTIDDHVEKITVQVKGTVPSVGQYSYDPPQQKTFASFQETHQGGASTDLGAKKFRPYTQQSQKARNAIDDAQRAVHHAQKAGASVGDAKQLVNNAVSAYDSGNFGNAESLAAQAKKKANASASSAKTNHWLFVGAGVVVVLVVIGAVVWWYLNQRDTHDPLG